MNCQNRLFTISNEFHFCSSLLFSLQLITREEFEDALKELQDEGMIVAMGKTTIRIC